MASGIASKLWILHIRRNPGETPEGLHRVGDLPLRRILLASRITSYRGCLLCHMIEQWSVPRVQFVYLKFPHWEYEIDSIACIESSLSRGDIIYPQSIFCQDESIGCSILYELIYVNRYGMAALAVRLFYPSRSPHYSKRLQRCLQWPAYSSAQRTCQIQIRMHELQRTQGEGMLT